MSWVRQSDASATHPIVLRVLEMEEPDDRILNELYGFVNRCATHSAAFDQDYLVSVGTAMSMAGSPARYKELIAAAIFCGYLTEVEVEKDGELRRAFKLVEEEDLFHMRLKAERDWDAQRKRDSRNPQIMVPVRLRDGDACRYCGKSVSWGDRKSGRGATLDHFNPGEAGTSETMLVCCRECNSRRKDDPDRVWKPLPPPENPFYGQATVALLAKHGYTVKPSYEGKASPVSKSEGGDRDQPVEQPDVAAPGADAATVAVSGPSAGLSPATTRTDTTQPAAPAPRGPDRSSSKSYPDLGHEAPGSSLSGSGRDGTGWDGQGRDRTGGDGRAKPAPPPSRSRQRRRRRKSNR